MANISSAFGDLTLKTDSLDNLARFIQLHAESEKNACYDTTLTDIEYLKKKDLYDTLQELATVDAGESVEIITDFTGSGRGTFSNNINWFFDVLKPDHDSELFTKEEIAELATHPFEATWDYTDSESGSNFIVKNGIVIKWDPTTKTTATSVNTSEETDYTVENLLAYDVYAKGEVWDTEFVKKNMDYTLDAISDDLNWANNLTSKSYANLLNSILANPEDFKKRVEENEDDCVYYELSEYLEENLYAEEIDS